MNQDGQTQNPSLQPSGGDSAAVPRQAGPSAPASPAVAGPAPTPLPRLAYAAPDTPWGTFGGEPGGKVPRWVIAVAAIYALLFLGLLVVLALGTILSDASSERLMCFAVLVVFVGAQAGLIYLPVRVLRLKPVRRRSLWPVLIATGLLTALLVLGGGLALVELDKLEETYANIIVGGSVVTWIVWAVVFFLASARRDPLTIGFRLHRHVIKGSILELLVAVPSHIIVRQRNECCAGLFTGFGIAAGVAVMFLAFGPSVLILFCKRFSDIRPKVPHAPQ